MENSAYEALITGINVTIFVIATTISIFLLTTVLKLSDLATNSNTNQKNNNVIISNTDISKRIVTGSELIGYYTNYTKEELKVQITPPSKISLEDYIKTINIDDNFINQEFELIYTIETIAGVDKELYLFRKIE